MAEISWNTQFLEDDTRFIFFGKVQDRTLFIKIHLMDYSISWEVLDRVFSRIGNIEYIEVFVDGSPFHSTVRFQEPQSAIKAFECYDGRFIYDGCCRMEVSLGNEANGRLSEIDVPIEDSSKLQSQESSRRIYKKLNEIRVLMGRCPVEVFSDETEKPALVQQMQKFELESTAHDCVMDLSLEVPTDSRQRKIEVSVDDTTRVESPTSESESLHQQVQQPYTASQQNVVFAQESVDEIQKQIIGDVQRSRPKRLADLVSGSLMDNNLGKQHVIHKSLETLGFEIASEVDIEELDEKSVISIDKIELDLVKPEMNPIESLEFGGAHKVLDKMPKTNIVFLASCFHLMKSNALLLLTDVKNSLTLMSECADEVEWVDVHSSLVFDPGIDDLYGFIGWDFTDLVIFPNKHETNVGAMMFIDHHNWIFDPGGQGA